MAQNWPGQGYKKAANYVPKRPLEDVIPNPKAKILDQVRDVMRLRHYSIRTEKTYCDWIKRFIKFHGFKSREELIPGEAKVEAYLTHLAVEGNVAASTQ